MRYFVFETDQVSGFNEPEGMEAGAALALVEEILKDEDVDPADLVVLKAEIVGINVDRVVSFK